MRQPPRFWERAEHRVHDGDRELHLRIWGWSLTSAAEASQRARDRLAIAIDTILHGGQDFDYYPRSPLREEVLHEITGSGGELLGVVTRNRLGVDVLNTDIVLIAAIDLPGQSVARRLFRRPVDHAAEALDRIAGWAGARPHLGVRAYRTAAGLRVVVTGVRPGEVDIPALEELGSDPVYVRLCAAHETYRARLTPKPHRVGHHRIPVSWPYLGDDAATADRWLQEYRAATRAHATCEPVSAVGPPPGVDEMVLVDLHDRVSRVGSGLPLA